MGIWEDVDTGLKHELPPEYDAKTVTERRAYVTSAERIKLLATKAAKYAKDPVANAGDKLTDRQIHELLARIVLAVGADNA